MTAKDWIKLASQLPENSRVTLTGGEPVVLKGFENVFDQVASKFECNIIDWFIAKTSSENIICY